MEHPYILPYIKQRMAELGHTKFHFESVKVDLKKALEPVSDVFYDYKQGTVPPPYLPPQVQFSLTKFYLLAYNEYYFLVEKTVPTSLRITSDTGCLTANEALNYSNYTFFNFKEFTGQIFFEAFPFAINLEFIKCTPY